MMDRLPLNVYQDFKNQIRDGVRKSVEEKGGKITSTRPGSMPYGDLIFGADPYNGNKPDVSEVYDNLTQSLRGGGWTVKRLKRDTSLLAKVPARMRPLLVCKEVVISVAPGAREKEIIWVKISIDLSHFPVITVCPARVKKQYE